MSVVEIPASRVAEPLAASPNRINEKGRDVQKLGDARVDRGAPRDKKGATLKAADGHLWLNLHLLLASNRQPLKRAELRLWIALSN